MHKMQQDIHWLHSSIEKKSLYIKKTLNYQKIENILYQNIFMNAVMETLNNVNI